MKTLFTSCLLLLILFSCNSENSTSKNSRPKEQTKISNNTNPNHFPFDFIRSHSIERKRNIDLEKLIQEQVNDCSLHPIEETFFKRWLQKVKVSGMKQVLRFDKPLEMLDVAEIFNSTYHFYDFTETAELFLFSILRYNQDSYEFELYHFTCDKNLGLIRQIDWIATSGGEGGYACESNLNYSKDGTKVTVKDGFTELLGDDSELSEVVTEYTFERKTTRQKVLKRSSRMVKNNEIH